MTHLVSRIPGLTSALNVHFKIDTFRAKNLRTYGSHAKYTVLKLRVYGLLAETLRSFGGNYTVCESRRSLKIPKTVYFTPGPYTFRARPYTFSRDRIYYMDRILYYLLEHISVLGRSVFEIGTGRDGDKDETRTE